LKIRKEKCKKCKGEGYSVDRGVLYRCPKCFGRGELDWLENIVGPKRDLGFPCDEDLIQRYYKKNTIMLEDWKKTNERNL
jgi:hypothetical protein